MFLPERLAIALLCHPNLWLLPRQGWTHLVLAQKCQEKDWGESQHKQLFPVIETYGSVPMFLEVFAHSSLVPRDGAIPSHEHCWDPKGLRMPYVGDAVQGGGLGTFWTL